MKRVTRPPAVHCSHRRGSIALLVLFAFLLSACQPESPRVAEPARDQHPADATRLLNAHPIGAPINGRPWIAHVTACDLDRDGRTDVLFCDAKENTIGWLRRTDAGFVESVLATDLSGPVRVEPSDIDGDGDLDLLVASMGVVFPSNDKVGAVIILENVGDGQFNKHVIADRIARVTDVRAADFDGDGRLDLAVGQFGYEQGEVRWMRNRGNWQFESQVLLNLAGTVNVCAADLTSDGHPDIVAVVSQQWEEIHLFEGDGRGNFTSKVIFGSINEDYGSSGIALCDLNGDARLDILYTNGDGFDYAKPGPRPWHGVQWLENQGNGSFKHRRIGDFPGAHSPVAVDLDRDGHMDVVVVSAFNDWARPDAASMMLFKNDGTLNFTPHVLARSPTHLLTCTAMESDASDLPVLVTGGFHAYPPWDDMSRLMAWSREEAR